MQQGDGWLVAPSVTPLTTAGAGTLLAGLFATGHLHRTGPGGAFADTVDTGANMDLAYPNLLVGDAIVVRYTVSVAFASTITAAAGITLKTAAANNIVAASQSAWLIFYKTGVGTYDLYVA
jgi:hypothetical protein